MEVAVWSEGELVLGGTSAVIVLVKPRRGREQILISSSSLCLCFQPAGSNQGCPGPASEVRLLGQSKTTKVRDASGSEKPMEDKQLKKEEEARGIYGITGKKKGIKRHPWRDLMRVELKCGTQLLLEPQVGSSASPQINWEVITWSWLRS